MYVGLSVERVEERVKTCFCVFLHIFGFPI